MCEREVEREREGREGIQKRERGGEGDIGEMDIEERGEDEMEREREGGGRERDERKREREIR